jgi:hypothetical protein
MWYILRYQRVTEFEIQGRYKGEGKVVPVLQTEHHDLKAYWGSGGIDPRILDLGTRRGWVVNFTPLPLYPEERAPDTHSIGDWVGSRAGLDVVVKRKIPSPRRDSDPRSSSP